MGTAREFHVAPSFAPSIRGITAALDLACIGGRLTAEQFATSAAADVACCNDHEISCAPRRRIGLVHVKEHGMRHHLSSLASPFFVMTVVSACGQESQQRDGDLASLQQGLDSSPLTAEYYKSNNLTGEGVLTQDDDIDHDWMGGAPLSGFPVDYFSVRWTGKLTPPATRTYTFYIHAYDGARV
ncbi:MAG TPA: PA14 domain-containing protein, partial [Polyangiaceae bacterium]